MFVLIYNVDYFRSFIYGNNLSNANSQITQLYSDMQAKNSPYGDILEPGDASGLNVNGYLMSRFGLNGVPTSKKGDKYYIAVDANNKLRSGIQINGADKITWKEIATKDDLGVAEYNAGKSIKISGRLSDIGKWLQTNGTTSRWMSVRANPTNTDGYFGSSTFSILWQCSSAEYGWCILMSDNPKMVVLGRNSTGWHWYAPSLTEVS